MGYRSGNAWSATRNYKEETYNRYGGAARQVEIAALEEYGKFLMVLRKDVPKDEVGIRGRFVYTIIHKSLKDGHARADAYVGGPGSSFRKSAVFPFF